MNSNYDRHTHPNAKKAGIGLTYRNASGQRPQTAQSIERDRRVAEIRGLLATVNDLSAAHVALRYGVKVATAEKYLAMAKGAMCEK